MLIMSVLLIGSFKFGYNCGVCTNQTYYSEKDKMCKPIKE